MLFSKHEPRTEILYVRVTKENMAWVLKKVKKLREQTKAKISNSEFVDSLLNDIRFLDNARKQK